jgi:hypothetical protein
MHTEPCTAADHYLSCDSRAEVTGSTAHEIFCVRPILEKAGVEWDSVSATFYFRKCGLVAKEIFYSISVWSNAFPTYNGPKRETSDLHCFSASLQTTHLEGPRTPGETATEWDPQTSRLSSCQYIDNVKIKILKDTLCAGMEIRLQVDTTKTQLSSYRSTEWATQ